jgi:predicted nucleic acid-binding protein
VIQEFAHVHARDRALVARAARDYADLLAPLIVVEASDLESGLELWPEAVELGAFDAVLAATARDRGADALVSADSAFSGVPGLHHVDPSGSELDEFLES